MDDDLFLPNFCSVHTVFIGIIVTQLSAFIIVLAPLGKTSYDWEYVTHDLISDIAMTSLFMQWITLVSMAILCWTRHRLSQLESNVIAGLLSYLIILLITLVISEFAYRLQETFFRPETRLFTPVHHWFLLQNLVISAVIGAIILGYIHYRQWWKTRFIIFSYLLLLLATLISSELVSYFHTPSWLQSQAAQHQLFLWRNFAMSAILAAIVLRYFFIQYYWKQMTQANANTQLQALQARIRPHFLFNSMNSIASLIRTQPEKAEQAVLDFADLFRASLVEAKQGVRLQDEILWCQQYLGIETLRLGERLQVSWDIEQLPQDALLPPLSLQPLLENAVYHGIQPLPEGGIIRIIGLFNGSQIELRIENPLPENATPRQGHRIAQHNIQQRLQFFFSAQAQFIREKKPSFYSVRIRFPYKTMSKMSSM